MKKHPQKSCGGKEKLINVYVADIDVLKNEISPFEYFKGAPFSNSKVKKNKKTLDFGG